MKTFKHKFLISLSSLLLSLAFTTSSMVSADNLNVSLTVGTGCISAITSNALNVSAANPVNLTVTNTDPSVPFNVSGAGIPAGSQIGPNTKTTNNSQTYNLGPLKGMLAIVFTPVPSDSSDPVVYGPSHCPIGSTPTPTSLTLTPVAAPANSSKSSATSKSASPTATPTTTSTSTSTSTPTATGAPTKHVSTPVTQQVNVMPSQKTSASQKAKWGIVLIIIAVLLAGYYFKFIPYRKIWNVIRRKL